MIFYTSKIILILSLAILLTFIAISISPYSKYLNYILVISSIMALIIFIFYKPKRPQYSNKINNDENVLFSDHEIILPDDKIEPLINLINSYSTLKSFSMALIGKWGSGKSSYLKTLNKKLKDDYEIITINVWQLENSENVTNELKKEFDNIIFEYNKILWLIQLIKRLFIRDYFSLLTKYATKTEIKMNFSFEQTIQNSQSEFNNLLKEILGTKKVLLLIDELDRIESKDEILNIFKLIRYTASFDNVFVLTALDIQQIEKQLDDINYIHKVFNLKYLVPTIDKDELLTYFEEKFLPKLSDLLNDSSNSNQQINYLDKKIKLISSYREVKNIFNDTYTFVKHLSDMSKNWYDFIPLEFIFNLNLLKAIDFEVYSFLLIDNGFKTYITYVGKRPEEKTAFLDKNKQMGVYLSNLERYTPFLNIYAIFRIEQYIDIYKEHKIYNYHIDDNKYQTFITDITELKKAYNQIRHNQSKNQINFLLNILNKNQFDSKNHKLVLNTIVPLINSSNYNNHKIFEKLATYDFIHEETKDIYVDLVKDNNKNNILYYILKVICTQEKIFNYNLVKDLIINYLDVNEVEEETTYNWLFSEPSNNNSYDIYKILYNYYNKSDDIKHILIHQTKKIEYIIKLMKKLETNLNDLDNFINDHKNYHIFYRDQYNEETISGQELKEIINDSISENKTH